jgi:acetyl esterase/lipase
VRLQTEARVRANEARLHEKADEPRANAHLTCDNTVQDLFTHPALTTFVRLILPWDEHVYDRSMRLRDVGSLLPYHTQVDPGIVVDGLNRLIDDVSNGKQVLYDFYTKEQKEEQPARSNTGLFFLRGNPCAPFAIIAPGGGFSYVASLHEGFPYALTITQHGYNAFVVKYRVESGGACATHDFAEAISYVFRNARSLGVATDGYSLWGSSAGARLAASVGSQGVASFGGDVLPRPSAVVIAYTGHSAYSLDEPPTFAVVGEDDRIAPPSVMQKRMDALRRGGRDVEFLRYAGVGHGFGPGAGTNAEGWLDRAIDFWERTMQA